MTWAKAGRGLWPFFLITMLPFACLHGGSAPLAPRPIQVETLYRATTCPSTRSEAHLQWIGSAADFKKIWSGFHAHRLGVAQPLLPAVDFAFYGVLVVHMGVQDSGGYALAVDAATVDPNKRSVTIVVNWISPPSGLAVTQAVTAPCVVLKLPKGDFERVEVVDPDNPIRLLLELTGR